ncbi:hypothetical protein ANCCAN_25808 [Ancylostoma caninum]|uniref:Uncharacterized protein n=1 Tax=Ancylostoma caninum TaxID=29170 RepID=A0A368FE27_ANCCA|nr:hypothetical protein ANCCAN_25808 [Ancylostoma caninum]
MGQFDGRVVIVTGESRDPTPRISVHPMVLEGPLPNFLLAKVPCSQFVDEMKKR